MDILKYNRQAWNKEVEKDNVWTCPVSEKVIEDARQGIWSIVLTPTKKVPRKWFPENIMDKKVLCLASGGGQQGPILAAAGAEVTVFDNSPRQLEQDEYVAKRDKLNITTELGDMRDLTLFPNNTFDLVVHPVSNLFVDSILPVWREATRVLKPGSAMLSGFMNPIDYIFDLKAWNNRKLVVRHRIPYSDIESLSEEERKELLFDKDEPLAFGHSLHDQIQGQIEAGFVIAGFYEDNSGGEDPLDDYIDTFIATKAVKIRGEKMESISEQHGSVDSQARVFS